MAQNASFSGRVLEPARLPVTGATIGVTERAMAVTRWSKTDACAFYSIPDLRPGRYSMRVAAAGFDAREHGMDPKSELAGGRQLNPAALIAPAEPVQGSLGRSSFAWFDTSTSTTANSGRCAAHIARPVR